ncbi:hypothetical protein FB645_000040 [Coemansia sp. IMI 203386]|nr:hypothetical protein FB645_000040 [Coemansia sp. IMI 203386]
MAKPEQATGSKLQQLSGFATASPFSQPPKVGSPTHPPSSNSAATPPGVSASVHMPPMAVGAPGRNISHERLPGPASFAPGGSASNGAPHAFGYGGPSSGLRRGSGMPPEKTPVGRSGVFGDMYGNDQFYRRHSVDIGVSIGEKQSHFSPPRHLRVSQQSPLTVQQQQQQPQQQPQQQQSQQPQQSQPPQQHHHVFGPSARYGSRSGAASPHPLSFDQTAGGLSSSGSGETGTYGSNSRAGTGSGSNSPGERGLKRSAPDNDGSMSPHMMDDDEPLRISHSSQPGVPTADKPYACDQCELTFSRQHNLKSHALTHSTERPFSCPICQTPFRRQHDLKRHMKLHTGEKPHTCTNCGRSFARLDALNRHMRAENFHACNQAAKKARTAVVPRHHEDPRLKSVTSAYLEQRRASTTSHPPGASGWSHWTHRPSIAADEAMLRRMQERFGAGPSYPQQQNQQSQTQSQTQSQYAGSSGTQGKSGSSHPHPHAHSQQPPQPANYGSSNDPRAYLAGASTSGGGGPQLLPHPQQQQQQQSLSHSKPWSSYSSSQSSLPSQRQPQPQSQQQQQVSSMRPRHGPGPHLSSGPVGPSSAQSSQLHHLENGGAVYGGKDGRRGSPERRQSESCGGGWQGGASKAPQNSSNSLGISSGPSRAQHHLSSQQQAPPPPPLASANSHPQANPHPHPHPHPVHMRLPPIDLAAPRRHSLAVTSHLERYRARNATPPPDGSAAPMQQSGQTEAGAESGAAGAAAPRHALHHHHSHAPLSTIYQSPPASNGAMYGGRSMQPPQQQMSPLPEGRTLPPIGASNAGGPGSGAAGPAPMPASFINYTPSVRQAPALQTPPKSGVAELPLGAPTINILPPPPGVDHGDSGNAGVSRRGSAYSGAEHMPDTRRSSIIALTNPPTESDIRLENSELKRRLDEMESKYQKEVERLNTIVRELEIEKSLLKSLLIEQRGTSSAGAASSAADADGMGDMMSVSPPPVARTSVSSGGQVTAVASEDMPLAHTIGMSSMGAGGSGASRSTHSLGTMSSPQSASDMHFRFGRQQQQPHHRQHPPTSSASTPGPNASRRGNV